MPQTYHLWMLYEFRPFPNSPNTNIIKMINMFVFCFLASIGFGTQKGS